MDTLRAELIESQKVRSDLLKWKLLIVAGLGGAALGFSGSRGPAHAPLALAVLPVACAYVDLLCRHLSLRNKAIGLYFEHAKHPSPELRAYEAFYRQLSDDIWQSRSFESWALLWSTLLVSAAVAPVGILATRGSWSPGTWPSALFYASSLLGIALAVLIQLYYSSWKGKAIDHAKPPAAGE